MNIKIKTSTFVILIITLLNTVGFALYFRSNNEQLSLKNLQINSLINEVGDLKNQNQTLYEDLIDQNQSLESTNQNLENISYQIGSLNKDRELNQASISSLQNSLNQTTDNFANQLVQKEKKISLLEEENVVKKMKDQAISDTESFLILGENMKLTDTIILVVINNVKQKITAVSIPRDLFYQGRKINEYYEFYGIDKIKEVVGEITGITPNHYFYINFNAFKDFVNLIGGVDININEGFTDKSFPTSNYGYKVVTFKKGIEHMDGERALVYARSRKSTSDFDRAARQQQILLAVKEKVKSMGIIKNLDYYKSIFDIVIQNTKTDMNYLDIIADFEKYKNFEVAIGNVLSTQNLLKSSTSVTGQFILQPKSVNYLSIQRSILDLI